MHDGERTESGWGRELESHGIVLAPGLLSADEVRALENVVDALVHADVPRSRQVLYTHGPAPADRPHFDTLMHQWLNPHRLAGPASTREVADALRPRVARMLGAEPVLLQDLVLLKHQGHPAFPWHQDFPFWPVDRPQGVIVWAPLVQSDEHSGGLSFARGSHRLGAWPAIDLHTGLAQRDARDPGPMLEQHEILRPRFHAGDAALFSPLTFHMSPANERGPARAGGPVGWTRGLCVLEDGMLVGTTRIRAISREYFRRWTPRPHARSRTAITFLPFDDRACVASVDVFPERPAKVFSILRAP